MDMCYWDFISILDTYSEIEQRKSGKEIIKEGVPQSNKDMIKRLKDKHG